jgi:MFS family permease
VVTIKTPTARGAEERLDPALLKLAAVMIIGAAAGLLDTTIVNVALKTIGHYLHSSITSVQWIMTSYLLSYGMVIPLSGWALARFGARLLVAGPSGRSSRRRRGARCR